MLHITALSALFALELEVTLQLQRVLGPGILVSWYRGVLCPSQVQCHCQLGLYNKVNPRWCGCYAKIIVKLCITFLRILQSLEGHLHPTNELQIC